LRSASALDIVYLRKAAGMFTDCERARTKEDPSLPEGKDRPFGQAVKYIGKEAKAVFLAAKNLKKRR